MAAMRGQRIPIAWLIGTARRRRGGGGVILVCGAPASKRLQRLTLNISMPMDQRQYGTFATNATLGQVTGIQSSSLCTPDLTLSKSHVETTRGSAASYTITVSN